MLKTQDYAAVTQIRMSREIDGKPVYWVAAYLVDDLLIDTGCSHTSQELSDFLEGKGVRQVVNTHYHEDHMGGNHDLMRRYGVRVYAHPDSIPLIAQGFDLYPYQEIAWGYPAPTEAIPVPDILQTPRHTFQVLETPGHCRGHICLMEAARGWCFTGDLFARAQPKFVRPEENIGQIMDSMRAVMAAAGPSLVLFTAVGKIVEDGQRALKDCLDYLSGLAARSKDLQKAGYDLDAIVRDLFGGEHPFAQLTNGQFSTFNLVRSLLESAAEKARPHLDNGR